MPKMEYHRPGAIVGKYQLFYFPLRGRAQPVRYFMIDNNIEYEDVYTLDGWLEKFKPMMPFGQAPMLRDGEFDIPQTNTILRYLGRKHGLHPEDVKEAAKVDMVMDFAHDIRELYGRLVWENFEEDKDKFVEDMKVKLQYLENLLKSWGNDYILTKVMYADYNLFDILDNFTILSSTILDQFPTVKAYHNRMASRPALKKCRDTDAFKEMKINGSGKQ